MKQIAKIFFGIENINNHKNRKNSNDWEGQKRVKTREDNFRKGLLENLSEIKKKK